ncbi:uncharacterized protein LOC131939397 [Physella acuta]|uniref:uncharacterized protein LOC131939397 n=1 Tax=Physella acuta TaxID=109671 RepID=UPI0027DE5C4C|nr:uncharacterized protein LOC131939397 [Physella acuta]
MRNSFTLMLVWDLVLCSIVWHSYKQTDSKTTCTLSLIEYRDTVAFNAKINFKHLSNLWSRFTGFQTSLDGGQTYQHLCLVEIGPRCKGNNPSICTCKLTFEIEVYDIEINLLAQKRYSEALIRGYINHSTDQPIYSKPQRFPKIYNMSEVQLQLNNIPLPTTTDNYEVDNYTIENRVCCLNSPSPCHIDIVTDQSNGRVGETCVDFNLTSLSLKDSQMVELRYTVCNAVSQKYWIKYTHKKGANVNASIKLMNYRQEDSQTSCHEGLRHGADNVVFKAQVCLTQENSIVKFVTKKFGDVDFHEVRMRRKMH